MRFVEKNSLYMCLKTKVVASMCGFLKSDDSVKYTK